MSDDEKTLALLAALVGVRTSGPRKPRRPRMADEIVRLRDENAALRRDAHEWRQAAQNLGEVLTPVGPDDYYSFSPDQWLAWAKERIGAIEKK